jgi:hypothetical protein
MMLDVKMEQRISCLMTMASFAKRGQCRVYDVMGQHNNNKKELQLPTEDPITQGSRKETEGVQETNFFVSPCVALVGWYNLV